MNIWDIVILVIVLGGAVFGLVRSRKHKGGCHTSCSCCDCCSEKDAKCPKK